MQTGLVTVIVLLSLKIVSSEHLASEESWALELPEWHDADLLVTPNDPAAHQQARNNRRLCQPLVRAALRGPTSGRVPVALKAPVPVQRVVSQLV